MNFLLVIKCLNKCIASLICAKVIFNPNWEMFIIWGIEFNAFTLTRWKCVTSCSLHSCLQTERSFNGLLIFSWKSSFTVNVINSSTLLNSRGKCLCKRQNLSDFKFYEKIRLIISSNWCFVYLKGTLILIYWNLLRKLLSRLLFVLETFTFRTSFDCGKISTS